MKKLVLTTACALAVTGSAFAQGSVNWGSISAGNYTAQTNSTLYSPLFGGGPAPGGAIGNAGGATGGFYFELLYNTSFTGSQVARPTTLAGLATWQDTLLQATNSATPGRLTVMFGINGAPVPWAAGTTNNIMLVGWSANLGPSWLVVSNELATGSYIGILQGLGQNGYFGVSVTGYINPFATGVTPGAAVFGSAATSQGLPIMSLLTPLYVLPVPEPTTIALIGLGGLSLLLFRRRQ